METPQKEIELTGNVIGKTFGKGSKSEHPAVFLETEQGSYKLKRQGGNPFRDTELESLVGKRIQATGSIVEYLFIISSYKAIE